VADGEHAKGARMQVKVGGRFRSVTGATEVVIVKAPAGDIDLRCGGHPMVPLGEDAPSAEPKEGFDASTEIGKRYAAEDAGIELLCTKAGAGALSLGDDLLPVKGAKPLPSSD
jgi:hypothetical protein